MKLAKFLIVWTLMLAGFQLHLVHGMDTDAHRQVCNGQKLIDAIKSFEPIDTVTRLLNEETVNYQDKESGDTPLMAAIKRGYTTIIDKILTHNPNLLLANKNHQTVISYIQDTLFTLPDIFMSMLRYAKQHDTTALPLLYQTCTDFIVQYSDHKNLIFWENLAECIQLGFNIHKTEHKPSLLVQIIQKNPSIQSVEKGSVLSKLLIWANPNDIIPVRNVIGTTEHIPLLLSAIRSENWHLFRFLIEKGADVNIQDNDGNTALMYLMESKYRIEVAQVYTLFNAQKDLNIDLKNKYGKSALDILEDNKMHNAGEYYRKQQAFFIKKMLGKVKITNDNLSSAFQKLCRKIAANKDLEHVRPFVGNLNYIISILFITKNTAAEYIDYVNQLLPILQNPNHVNYRIAYECVEIIIGKLYKNWNLQRLTDSQINDWLTTSLTTKNLGLLKILFQPHSLNHHIVHDCIEHDFHEGLEFILNKTNDSYDILYITKDNTEPLKDAVKLGREACVRVLLNHRCNPGGQEVLSLAQPHSPIHQLLSDANRTTIADLPNDVLNRVLQDVPDHHDLTERLKQIEETVTVCRQFKNAVTDLFKTPGEKTPDQALYFRKQAKLHLATNAYTKKDTIIKLWLVLEKKQYTLFCMLLDQNKDLINGICPLSRHEGQTFLIYLVNTCDEIPLNVIQQLIQYGANINAPASPVLKSNGNKATNKNIDKDKTPLDYALAAQAANKEEVVTYLRSKGALTARDLSLNNSPQPALSVQDQTDAAPVMPLQPITTTQPLVIAPTTVPNSAQIIAHQPAPDNQPIPVDPQLTEILASPATTPLPTIPLVGAQATPPVSNTVFNTIITLCNKIATNANITPEIIQAFMQLASDKKLPPNSPQEYYDHCIKQLEPILKDPQHKHYKFACVCTHEVLHSMKTDIAYYQQGLQLLDYAIQSKNIGLFLAICSYLDYKNIPLFAHNEATILHLCAQHDFVDGARLLFEKNKEPIWLCVDTEGFTPLNWAINHASTACITFLEEAITNKKTIPTPVTLPAVHTQTPIALPVVQTQLAPINPRHTETLASTATTPLAAVSRVDTPQLTPLQTLSQPPIINSNPAPAPGDNPPTINTHYFGKKLLAWGAGLSLATVSTYALYKYFWPTERDDEDEDDMQRESTEPTSDVQIKLSPIPAKG